MRTLLVIASTLVALAAAASAQVVPLQFQILERGFIPRTLRPGAVGKVCHGDVDGDGNLDLFLAAQRSRLYLNNGRGAFVDVTATHLPDRQAFACALGDVDGDGDLDLVLATAQGERLYLNNGKGVFKDSTLGRMPAGPRKTGNLVLSDVDLDKDLDLVLGMCLGATNKLYLNNGKGVFSDGTSGRLPKMCTSDAKILAVDLNGDRAPDLLFDSTEGLGFLLNNGKGVFKDASSNLPVPGGMVNLGDLDKDGDLDMCLVDQTPGRRRLAIFLNNGKGVFSDATVTALGSKPVLHWAWGLLDQDADGDLDLVTSYMFAKQPELRVWRNNGKGQFADLGNRLRGWRGDVLPSVWPSHRHRFVAEVNGDKRPDLFLGPRALLFLDSQGFLIHQRPYRRIPYFPADHTVAIAHGDVDGDGDTDLVIGNGNPTSLTKPGEQNRLYLNDGDGRFEAPKTPLLPQRNDVTQALALADLDNDGDLDLLVGNNGLNYLYRNDGKGSFSDAKVGQLPSHRDNTRAFAVGDIDGDGQLDVIVGNDGHRCRVYQGSKSGTLWDVTKRWLPINLDPIRDLALGDIDRDGDLDLVAANYRKPPRVFLNDSKRRFLDKTSTQLPVLAKQSPLLQAVHLIDADFDKDLDLVLVGGGWTILYNNGKGIFPATPTFKDGVSSLGLADTDGDGVLDFIVVPTFRPHALIRDKKFPNIWARAPLPDAVAAYSNSPLLARDLDLDGDADIVAVGSSGWTVAVNLLRHMDAPVPAMLGSDYVLDVYDGEQLGSFTRRAALPYLSLGKLEPRLSLGRVGLVGLEPKTLLPLPGVQIPAISGRVSLKFQIPSEPSLKGLRLYAQTLLLGPAVLTNVVQAVVLQ